MGYFKKTNVFLVYFMCFDETVHDKWCWHKSVRHTENGLERGFVEHWLNSVQITGRIALKAFKDFCPCMNGEIKNHVYGKWQSSDSSRQFLKIRNEQLKTVKTNSCG